MRLNAYVIRALLAPLAPVGFLLTGLLSSIALLSACYLDNIQTLNDISSIDEPLFHLTVTRINQLAAILLALFVSLFIFLIISLFRLAHNQQTEKLIQLAGINNEAKNYLHTLLQKSIRVYQCFFAEGMIKVILTKAEIDREEIESRQRVQAFLNEETKPAFTWPRYTDMNTTNKISCRRQNSSLLD